MSRRYPISAWHVKTDCPAWAPPLLAVQFLTRVPVPGVSKLSEEAVRVGLGRAVGWFPLVGTLVGAVTAAALLNAEKLWPRAVAVILALIVEAYLTGAFHEDAVADFCDGAGGGRDPEHTRQIMKDSRIGSYGALGLTLAVALRAALMFALSPVSASFVIIAAATSGRLLAAVAMAAIPPAPRAQGLGKDIGAHVGGGTVVLACVTAIPGLFFFALNQPAALLIAGAVSVAFLLWFRSLVLRRVGGSTGDCLGFAAYAGQLIVLLAAVAS